MWLPLGICLTGCFFALLDGWYWLRTPWVIARNWLQPAVRDLLAEHTVRGRVMPTDLDWLMHMNNGRYLREADFARFSHFMRSGIFPALRALGANMVMASCAARFRRSLRFLEPFEVRTRLLCWDQSAFYVEQRFVSPRDGRVCAVLLSCQHILASSPDKVVQYLCKRKVESPEFPEEVVHWIAFNQSSSQKLRAESGLTDDVKAQ
ncbi:protein THEM6 [Ambystoma mexicanum]|uniref:protein THEM6 n=1 Tax=Ambystoma mexicanum TaxID=8296 RepID=UPI0037E7B1EE